MANLNTLKNWFKNGLKPTQEQFWIWMDSYWHKEEKIPLNSIENIEGLFDGKADQAALESHTIDEDAHELPQRLATKVDVADFQNHLEEEDAHELPQKLATKVDLEQFAVHLDDEDAHDLLEKLATKIDVEDFQNHLVDLNAHGIVNVKDEVSKKLNRTGDNLELGKGTATIPPLIIPHGTLTTVPVNGAVETDSTGALYITQKGVRELLLTASWVKSHFIFIHKRINWGILDNIANAIITNYSKIEPIPSYGYQFPLHVDSKIINNFRVSAVSNIEFRTPYFDDLATANSKNLPNKVVLITKLYAKDQSLKTQWGQLHPFHETGSIVLFVEEKNLKETDFSVIRTGLTYGKKFTSTNSLQNYIEINSSTWLKVSTATIVDGKLSALEAPSYFIDVPNGVPREPLFLDTKFYIKTEVRILYENSDDTNNIGLKYVSCPGKHGLVEVI